MRKDIVIKKRGSKVYIKKRKRNEFRNGKREAGKKTETGKDIRNKQKKTESTNEINMEGSKGNKRRRGQTK